MAGRKTLGWAAPALSKMEPFFFLPAEMHALRSTLPNARLLFLQTTLTPAKSAFQIRRSIQCKCTNVEAAASIPPENHHVTKVSNNDLVDILKIDLRVGKITSVEAHPEAEELLIEEVDVGETEPRVIVSGLKNYTEAAALEGSPVVVVCNLKPRKLRGVQSHGMLLCASNSDHSAVEPLVPPSSIPGERLFFGHGSHQEPVSPNQVQKKKIWESCLTHLRTDSNGIAHYKEYAMMTSEGPVSSILRDASLS